MTKNTNRNLQPITPLIYYSTIFSDQNMLGFLENLKKCCVRRAKKKLNSEVIGLVNMKQISSKIEIGAIFMEMRDGYQTLYSILDDNYLLPKCSKPRIPDEYLAMVGETLNRLHYVSENNSGIIHGDLHLSNILINTE